MYTLRLALGDDAVNAALRRFLEKHRGGGPPHQTSRDLLAQLRAVTPASLTYLLTDLFARRSRCGTSGPSAPSWRGRRLASTR